MKKRLLFNTHMFGAEYQGADDLHLLHSASITFGTTSSIAGMDREGPRQQPSHDCCNHLIAKKTQILDNDHNLYI